MRKIYLFLLLLLILIFTPKNVLSQSNDDVPNDNAEDHSFFKYYGDTKKFDSIQSVSFGTELYHTHKKDSNFKWLKYKIEMMIIDDRRKNGTDQDYISAGAGGEIIKYNFYISTFLSCGFITAKDAYLGGPFQFSEDISIGYRFFNSNIRFGTYYKHISSGGIYKVNRGKDLFGFGFFIPF